MNQLRYDNMQNDSKPGKWSIHSMAMFMLGAYIILSSTFEFVAGYGYLNTLSLYAFLGIGALNVLYKKNVVFFGNYYFLAILLYFIMLTFSLFYSPFEIQKYVNMYYYRYFTIVVISFIVANLIETSEDLNYLINTFVFAGVVMVISFVSTYGEQMFSLANQVAEAERLGEDFGNLNLVAQRLTFSMIFSMYMFAFKAKRFKWFYFLVTISCLAVILLTGSRKALLVVAVLAVFMFYQFSKGKSLKFKLWSFVIVAAIIAAVTVVIINVPMFSSIKIRIDITIRTLLGSANMYETKSDANRMRYISEGIRHWLKNPFIGNGMAYSYYLFGTYSHNNYIELLLNTGVIGGVIYYYPYLRTLLCALKRKSNIEKNFKTLLISVVLAIAVIDIGVVTYYDRYICIIMSTISSAVALKILKEKSE